MRQKSMTALSYMLVFILCFNIPVIADVEDNLTYQGNKARIAVGKIKSKARKCNNDMAASVGEMLSTALTNNEKFIVLASQEEIDELADEIDFAQSGYAEEGRGPEKGLMESADLLITGSITAFEPEAKGGGGMLGGFKKKAFGKIGVDSKTAEIILDLKLIDIRTRRVLKAEAVEAKSTSWGSDVAAGGWADDIALSGGLGVYSNQPMEKAIRAMLVKTVDVVSKEVPDEYYRYKGKGEYTTEYGESGSGEAGMATSSTGATGGSTAQATEPPAEDMTLYTRYDFIPGDKVIFYDDLSDEEEGEFPYRWNLENGVFEIARMGGEYWILCTDDGHITPKIPAGPFPEKYTVEMEIYDNGPDYTSNYFYLYWVDAKGKNVGSFGFYANDDTWLEIQGKSLSDKQLPEPLTRGSHMMRVMATARSIKCYVDNIRVANVPKVEGFNPVGFKIRIRPYNDPDNPALFRDFRFAEGGKSMRDQLAEDGKIVTHGILFDVGSAKIKAESYKTLKEIGELLSEDASLRLSIEGHTDSDGSDESNMTLSQNRANSVRQYLISNYGISGERLEAKGWGESKPMSTNNTSEGKAENRRVELIKL